jgi:hypothetical protein
MQTVYRLPAKALRFAVLNCILDRMDHEAVTAALWREDAAEVGAIYADVLRARDDCLGPEPEGRHGLLAERMWELRQPLLSRPKQGLTITELAKHAGFDRETIASGLEHHGFVELVPFGGPNRRRLVTRAAEKAGFGHNPHGGNTHVGRLEGFARATPFPVFYHEYVERLLWALDLPGIRDAAAAMPTKRARLRWLLDHHDYLPNQAVADFAECTCRAVEKARSRETSKVRSCVIGP